LFRLETFRRVAFAPRVARFRFDFLCQPPRRFFAFVNLCHDQRRRFTGFQCLEQISKCLVIFTFFLFQPALFRVVVQLNINHGVYQGIVVLVLLASG